MKFDANQLLTWLVQGAVMTCGYKLAIFLLAFIPAR